MQQRHQIKLDRYEYTVYFDETHGNGSNLFIKGYLINKCKCCQKSLTADYPQIDRSHWIVCRDPHVQKRDGEPIGEAEKLQSYTLQHGPFTQAEARHFINLRQERIEALKREGD